MAESLIVEHCLICRITPSGTGSGKWRALKDGRIIVGPFCDSACANVWRRMTETERVEWIWGKGEVVDGKEGPSPGQVLLERVKSGRYQLDQRGDTYYLPHVREVPPTHTCLAVAKAGPCAECARFQVELIEVNR